MQTLSLPALALYRIYLIIFDNSPTVELYKKFAKFEIKLNINIMKKLLLLLVICLPIFSFSQKIQNVKTKEIVELKETVENYCAVVMQPYRGKIDFFIGTNELGVWKLLDENQNPIKFETIVAIMNFMDKNGWEYINNIGGSSGAAPQYFFKKKE